MTPTDRKLQILEVARDLLQTQGYDGFSYQDLSDRLGLAKPSLHHHFPTKEALAIAVIGSYADELDEMRAALDAESSCSARLALFLSCDLSSDRSFFPSSICFWTPSIAMRTPQPAMRSGRASRLDLRGSWAALPTGCGPRPRPRS